MLEEQHKVTLLLRQSKAQQFSLSSAPNTTRQPLHWPTSTSYHAFIRKSSAVYDAKKISVQKDVIKIENRKVRQKIPSHFRDEQSTNLNTKYSWGFWHAEKTSSKSTSKRQIYFRVTYELSYVRNKSDCRWFHPGARRSKVFGDEGWGLPRKLNTCPRRPLLWKYIKKQLHKQSI